MAPHMNQPRAEAREEAREKELVQFNSSAAFTELPRPVRAEAAEGRGRARGWTKPHTDGWQKHGGTQVTWFAAERARPAVHRARPEIGGHRELRLAGKGHREGFLEDRKPNHWLIQSFYNCLLAPL